MSKPESKLSRLPLLEAMRPTQWVKNILLAVPMLVGQQVHERSLWVSLLIATACFCVVTSSVYLVNDLFDIESDRQHPVKRHRPLASGRLSKRRAITATLLLLVFGFALSYWLLPRTYVAALGLYLATATLYTFWLKERQVIDMVVLAGLYSLRLIAGGAATGVVPSFWLLAFSMFIFFNLAVMKRYAELLRLKSLQIDRAAGRGYQTTDLSILAAVGPVSGYLGVLVFALYIDSSAVTQLYTYPQLLWLICPLLIYWITRMWLLANRGTVDEDPLVFTLHDRASWITAGCIVLVAVLAAL